MGIERDSEDKDLACCLAVRRKCTKMRGSFSFFLFFFNSLIIPVRGPSVQQGILKSSVCSSLCLSPASTSALLKPVNHLARGVRTLTLSRVTFFLLSLLLTTVRDFGPASFTPGGFFPLPCLCPHSW